MRKIVFFFGLIVLAQQACAQDNTKVRRTNPTEFSTVVMERMSDADRITWLATNADGTGKLTNDDLEYKTYNSVMYINLYKFNADYRLPTQSENRLIVEWLRRNFSRINIDETQKFLLRTHLIDHPENIGDIVSWSESNYSKVFTVEDLKARVGASYNTDAYTNYVYFPNDPNPITVSPDYDITRNPYSVQMLKGIIKTHNLTNTSKLAVGNYDGRNFIWVVGTSSYFNFSNDPR